MDLAKFYVTRTLVRSPVNGVSLLMVISLTRDSVLIGGVVLITGVSSTMFWVRGVPSVASIIGDVSSGVI